MSSDFIPLMVIALIVVVGLMWVGVHFYLETGRTRPIWGELEKIGEPNKGDAADIEDDSFCYAPPKRKRTRSLEEDRLVPAQMSMDELMMDFNFTHEATINVMTIVPQMDFYRHKVSVLIDRVNDMQEADKWKGVPTETLFRAAFNELVQEGVIT